MKKNNGSAPLQVGLYYANLDDIRTVMGLLDEPAEDAPLPSVLKSAQYGRYCMYCVCESIEIGVGRIPCENVTYTVLYNGSPIFLAKGLGMSSSVALTQAKDSFDISVTRNYNELFKQALREVDGLSDKDLELILNGGTPAGYDSLIFDKAMAEDSDKTERLLLLPYIWVSEECDEHFSVINAGLDDFCDLGRRRIIAIDGGIEAVEDACIDGIRECVEKIRAEKLEIKNSVFIVA